MVHRFLKPLLSAGDSPEVKLYRQYRKIGKDLNHKIMQATLSRAATEFAARALKISRGNTLVVDSEDDLTTMIEFAMYEHRVKGKNAVERYQEEIGGKDQIEQELLAGMIAAQSSLFRIESISPQTCLLHLGDVVNAGQSLDLIDINFSQSGMVGYLLFIRPIVLEKFGMTSGVAMGFPGDQEQDLLRRVWGVGGKSRLTPRTPAERYAKLFKLSKRTGIDVRYEEKL